MVYFLLFWVLFFGGSMIYDIIVVGAGPAGLTAAIYAKRANKNVLVIERGLYGGQVATIGEVENYPGFLSIHGSELAQVFYSQAKKVGVEFVHDNMVDLLDGKIKSVVCKKATYQAKAVVLALGSMSRELNVEGEKQFIGSGVSYCATCDGAFFKGKDVAVVGSGDSAVATALYLNNICKSVCIISKYPKLKLKAYQPNIFDRLKNVKIYYSALVQSIQGDGKVEGLVLDSGQKVKVDGIFVTIGRKPDTEFLKNKINLDEKGYIITDETAHSSMEGVFACGDVSTIAVKQIVTAAATGAIAATSALNYITEH